MRVLLINIRKRGPQDKSDLLKSFETTSQAEEITKEPEELLAKGGSQLTRVMSN